ncbi:MAG: fused response regulator/phosphatase [Desulfobulbaceae bacterium]|nr:MAG: fused response regulator/phosphatase [Desulfobulbaceae bacterium]
MADTPQNTQGGILIIDDNEVNRMICAMHLEDMKTPLLFAENGREGIALARACQPDLILLDIMMPVMDGFETLARLKRDSALAEIPVLILSAKSETDSIVRALELGASDYLKKPFEEEEMVARVKTLLRSRYLEQQLKEDLLAGATMQKRFLTDAGATIDLFRQAGIATAIHNRPYGGISGDFYYSYPLTGSGCGIFLGDSCGHGLPAALISMRIIGVLQQIVRDSPSPGEILARLNADIIGLLPASNFVAGSCLAFFANTCTMSSAGQPYAVHLSGGTAREVVLDALPLGIHPETVYGQETLSFAEGDRLVVFTDGLLEGTDWQEQCYGRRRLLDCLKRKASAPSLAALKDAILEDVQLFGKNAPINDDQTLLLFERENN